jgi:hypothetical protein
VGYWLGIAGGSMMALLVLYSARKRIPGLQRLGSIPTWFNVHMFLGVAGPVLILFHTTFHLGATNSNVALFTMVLVAVSGVLGRYIYTGLHAALDARVRILAKLQNRDARGQSARDRLADLPGLLDTLDRLEMRLSLPPKDAVAPHFMFAPRVTEYLSPIGSHVELSIAQSASPSAPGNRSCAIPVGWPYLPVVTHTVACALHGACKISGCIRRYFRGSTSCISPCSSCY